MTYEIFIPFWGDPGLLYDAVASVQAQTVSDWRLIVIDDAYPDESVGQWFADLDDERVIYRRNQTNLGITENFNESVQQATAEYLTIMGCDDLLLPNYVETVLETIAAVPDADIIEPGVEVIDEKGDPYLPLVDLVKQRLLAPPARAGVTALTGQDLATSLIRGNWLYWPSLAFRTQTVRQVEFRDGLPIISDLALLMDIAFAGGTLAYNPTKAFAYRRHSASASQTTVLDGRRFRDEREYYALARQLAAAQGWGRTARTARWRLMSRLQAITELPNVVRNGQRAGIRSAAAHIVAP